MFTTTTIEQMNAAIAKGQIHKAGFDVIKGSIERSAENAWKPVHQMILNALVDKDEALYDIYYGSAPTAHTFKTVQKRVAKLSPKYAAIISAAEAVLTEIAPTFDRLATLKGLIAKRQTKAETAAAAKAAYRAPATEIAITNKVRDLLNDHADAARSELVDSIISYTDRMVSLYLKAEPVRGRHPSLGKFFGRNHDTAVIVGRCIENHAAPVRKATADATILAYAEQNATEILAAFIEKNLTKMVSIIARKGDFANAEFLRDIRRGGLVGTIRVTFEDGSHFTVDNIVFVENSFGTQFNRFPTTFHNVYLRGTKLKNVSEKKMNEVFAVAA